VTTSSRQALAELSKDYNFEAAHRLPNVPPGHQCGQMHGHSYRISVHVAGEIGETSGWAIDFGDISAVVKPVVTELDHSCLNDIPGLANPTSELLSQWLWHRLKADLPQLVAVTVRETESSSCVFRGPVE